MYYSKLYATYCKISLIIRVFIQKMLLLIIFEMYILISNIIIIIHDTNPYV